MAIVFNCPNCGKSISAPDSGAGKRGKCPTCGSPIQVPAAGDEAPDPFGSSTPPAGGGQNPFGGLANDEPAPPPRRRRREEVEDDYDDEPRPRRRPRDEDDDDYDDAPRPRRRRRDDDDDYDDDPRPRRRRPARKGGSDDPGMVWGILSIVFGFCCALLGLIFGFVGLSKASKSDAPNAGTVKVLSIIGIVISILNIAAAIVLQVMGDGFGGGGDF